MAETPSRPTSFMDRLFVYGIRSLLIVLGLVALGVLLAIHGGLVSRLDYIASGIIIVLIGVGIGVAAMQTQYTMITKRYFAPETLVGKTGRAVGAIRANSKGVVHIEHETWTSIAEEDIARGESVVVTAVDPDKITLRVRRAAP